MTTPALRWRPTSAPVTSSRTDDIGFVDFVYAGSDSLITNEMPKPFVSQWTASGTKTIRSIV